MKNLLAFILILSGFTVSAQIVNGGFENWHPYANGEYPDGWQTSDSVSVSLGGGNNATKGTDSYEGSFCLHLKSVQAGFVKGPGIATNGNVNLVGVSFVFSGGSPTASRARFLTGQYKYSPMGPNDAGVIQAYLFSSDSISRDTIAVGSMEITTAAATYTPFTLELAYKNWSLQPDTCLIILQSSRTINDPGLAVGTELVIDSLNFTGVVGVDEINSQVISANVYPTPASNEIYLDITTKNNISLQYEIYDTRGSMMLSDKLTSAHQRIDTGKLSAGTYVVNVLDMGRKKMFTKNISISK